MTEPSNSTENKNGIRIIFFEICKSSERRRTNFHRQWIQWKLKGNESPNSKARLSVEWNVLNNPAGLLYSPRRDLIIMSNASSSDLIWFENLFIWWFLFVCVSTVWNEIKTETESDFQFWQSEWSFSIVSLWYGFKLGCKGKYGVAERNICL